MTATNHARSCSPTLRSLGLSASLIVACAAWAGAQGAQLEIKTKTVSLASGALDLTVGATYDFVPHRGPPIRGQFLNANSTEVKLAVAESADGQRVDSIYLPIRNIKSITVRKDATIRVRDEIPLRVADPYKQLRIDLEKTEEEKRRAAELAASAELAGVGGVMTPQPVVPTPPPVGELGPVAPALEARVEALLGQIQHVDVALLDPAAASAIENVNKAAREALRQLGPPAVSALVSRLGSASPPQLEALVSVVLTMGEPRAVPLILAEWQRRGMVPSLDVLSLMARAGPQGSAWLTSLAASAMASPQDRRNACQALVRAPPDPNIAQSMTQIIGTLPASSPVAGAAIAVIARHAAQPAEALITLVRITGATLLPLIVNELAVLQDASLDARLVEVGEQSGNGGVRRCCALALLRRLSASSDRGVLNWLNAFADSVDGERVLLPTLQAFSRLRMPARNQGVSYDAVLRASFGGSADRQTILAGLAAVSILADETSDEVCDGIIDLWRDLLAMSPTEQAKYRDCLSEMSQVTRKIAGRPISTPDTFDTWLSNR